MFSLKREETTEEKKNAVSVSHQSRVWKVETFSPILDHFYAILLAMLVRPGIRAVSFSPVLTVYPIHGFGLWQREIMKFRDGKRQKMSVWAQLHGQ